MSETVRLQSGDASAALSLRGAEPVSWRVGGRELIWGGDPAHWSFHAPILFPVVGSSSGGVVRVDGRAYPMPQHGFARQAAFGLVASEASHAHLRLRQSDATRTHYPFAFALDVEADLNPTTLSLAFTVTNTDAVDFPFAIGFHPAFPWPFDGGPREAYRVAFAEPENPSVPGVTATALLTPAGRTVPLDGRHLALDPAIFSEALVFLDARSRSLAFEAPSGAAIDMAVMGFPHLAVWSRPDAPFLSLEAWTGHADWDGFSDELARRASIRILAPGESARHTVAMTWRDAGRS